MPIFEYKRKGCGQEFEELVLAEGKEVKCPECGEADCEKLISRLGRIDGESYEHSGDRSCDESCKCEE